MSCLLLGREEIDATRRRLPTHQWATEASDRTRFGLEIDRDEMLKVPKRSTGQGSQPNA